MLWLALMESSTKRARRALALVVTLGGCTWTHQVHHLSPATSEPGRAGFSVTEVRTSAPFMNTRRWNTGAVAMTPPVPHATARDVVWRATTRGDTLEFCRPNAQGRHRCQLVPLPEGAYGGQVIFIDNKNLGNVRLEVTTLDRTVASGSLDAVGTQDAPMTPHYGVWVSSWGGYLHCRVRDNQPECQPAMAHAFPGLGIPAALPLAVLVVQVDRELRDVLWLGRPDAQGFVRCEGRAAEEPKCEPAKMLP